MPKHQISSRIETQRFCHHAIIGRTEIGAWPSDRTIQSRMPGSIIDTKTSIAGFAKNLRPLTAAGADKDKAIKPIRPRQVSGKAAPL
jgi:hypothetical protein